MAHHSSTKPAGLAFYRLKAARNALAHLHLIMTAALDGVEKSIDEARVPPGQRLGIWCADSPEIRSLQHVADSTLMTLHEVVESLEGAADDLGTFVKLRHEKED